MRRFNVVAHLEIWSSLEFRGNVFVFLVMVWFSSLTMFDRTGHSWFEICYKRPNVTRWTISRTVQLLLPEMFICYLPRNSACQNMVSPEMKIKKSMALSHGWHKRDIRDVLCVQDGQIMTFAWAMKRTKQNKYTHHNFILHCLFPLLKSWFLSMRTANLISYPISCKVFPAIN
jgi:hypothetical protein